MFEKSPDRFQFTLEFPALREGAHEVAMNRINAVIERNSMPHPQEPDDASKSFDDFAKEISAFNEEKGGAFYLNRSTNYETYPLKDGHTLTLADFADPARDEALRKQRGANVQFERLPLDDHFAPLKTVLVFHYPPGETTVAIPWAAVEGV
ncbi:MAG: hypothetical protein FJW38_32070 [Acidobacteria bacterium]|nr:hypothetical protein [Acidobacteriota bacterium]